MHGRPIRKDAQWPLRLSRRSQPRLFSGRIPPPLQVLAILALSLLPALATGAAADEPDPTKPAVGVAEAEAETALGDDAVAPVDVAIVEGQITDALGQGHPGVQVTVHRRRDDGSPGALLGTATTDEMGDFTVRVAKPVRGPVIVRLSASQYQPVVREFDLDPDDYPPFVGEELDGVLILVGRVVDALHDHPIAEAEVKLEIAYREWTATSNERGEFLLEGIVPGEGLLTVEAEGYGRERLAIPEMATQGDALVALKPERTLRLTVVDADPQPIAGVSVEAIDEARDDYRLGVTDAQGVCVLRGWHFDCEELLVKLQHEAYVSSAWFDRPVALTRTQTATDAQLEMQRAGTITGQVRNQRTDSGISGARVLTGSEYSDSTPRDWADDDGHFRIIGVPAGPTVVTVHARGYAPELRVVEVAAGETAKLDLFLQPGQTLTGQVTDKDGKPLPHAQLLAGRWRDHQTLGLRAVADAEGRFVLADAPSDPFELTVYIGSFEAGAQTVQAGAEPVALQVSASARRVAEGGQLIETGQPAPDFAVTTLGGRAMTLGELRGKVILLQFWATWCPPCVAEVPELVKIAKQFGNRPDFVQLGISLDHDEGALRKFMEANRVTWPQVYGEAGGAHQTADSYGVHAIPAILLIDRNGQIQRPPLDSEGLAEAIQAALAQPEPPPAQETAPARKPDPAPEGDADQTGGEGP